jgi:4-amino-4-deoxy-L-arabinose transferase-like glycosyltransferase
MLNKLRTIPLPLAAVALLAFVYVVVRAVVVPFTWDESFSWLMYARGHDWWPEINSEMAANNHLLNTWLMRLSEMIFGTSEFTLRLPNVLFSLLYFTAAFFFAKRQEKTLAQLAVFIVLAGHPYLLDYFGIARGYGLAHSLLLFGLWLLWKWCNGEKLFYAVAALVAISLSCLPEQRWWWWRVFSCCLLHGNGKAVLCGFSCCFCRVLLHSGCLYHIR